MIYHKQSSRVRRPRQPRISPDPALCTYTIPNETPPIVARLALNEKYRLMAHLRHSRLLDEFLGLRCIFLQYHPSTAMADLGQIEIDELYIGMDRHGYQYVIPVQAKGGSDQLAPMQTKRDIICCRELFPQLECRAVAAQFMDDGIIALFELRFDGETVTALNQKHYRLAPADTIPAAICAHMSD